MATHVKRCLLVLLSFVVASSALAQEMVMFVGSESTGNLVVVNKGMQVKIVLPGNAASGHQWEIVADGSPVLVPAGEVSYLPEGATTTAGGRFTVVFKAQQGGETRIRLAYRQLADTSGVPLRTYELPVRVPTIFSIGEVFTSLDTDADGRIVRAEFMQAKSIPASLNANGHVVLPVGVMTPDSKGEISRDAMRTFFFDDMDLDRNGIVDPVEMQKSIGQGFSMLAW